MTLSSLTSNDDWRTCFEALQRRRSAKWKLHSPDVLPMWVAEMDFPLAGSITRVLTEAVRESDTGYPSLGGLGETYAAWAMERWGWRVEPADVHPISDVVTGISEILRVATKPGEQVVISPPVYPPFAGTIRALGRVVVDAPLTRRGPDGAYALDLEAIEQAYRSGARVHLLCSPENPTGVVHSRETLEALGALAAREGVLILSDEIHAPLTLPGAEHHPLPSVSAAAEAQSIVLGSASKAWNIAGLKLALMVASGPEPRRILSMLPPESAYHVGHFGVLAATAASTEGGRWLDEVRSLLVKNREALGQLLAEHLPEVRYRPPEAGYLAWLDFRALDLGDNPAAQLLEHGRVALSSGPTFGVEGKGFARLNFATTPSLLEEGVRRMEKAVRALAPKGRTDSA